MRYKYIFSDFDGTISRSDNTVSDKVKDAIARYVAAGGKFVVATGRLFSAVYPRVQALGLHGEVIVYQGGGIFDIDSRRPLWLNTIDTSLATEVLGHLEKLDYCENLAYFDDKCHCAHPSEYTDVFCDICGVPYYPVNMPLSEYISENSVKPIKLLSLMMPEHTEHFLEYGRSVCGDRMVFTRSNKCVVEMLPVGINKGEAVRRLAEKWGADRSEIICLGDAENDISMIEYAGLGIAAGNAMEKLKAAAGYVGVSNDEDFVAHVIDKFCLSGDYD